MMKCVLPTCSTRMRCAAAYQKEGNKAMHNKGFEKETFKETVRENN
mgnify:FL=1